MSSTALDEAKQKLVARIRKATLATGEHFGPVEQAEVERAIEQIVVAAAAEAVAQVRREMRDGYVCLN